MYICVCLLKTVTMFMYLKVREDSADKVFIPGWQRQLTSSTGTWLSTMSGECIGIGDLVAYYVDSQETRRGKGYTAVGKNELVLQEVRR